MIDLGDGSIQHVLVVPDFFAGAAELRSYFDQRFLSPESRQTGRFLWDYWHVPDQYTYIRTFAQYFFPPELYGAFTDRLRSWGSEALGCDVVGAPWLSYYVDGCLQELHADVPHGPWAYVFSLTDWEHRRFSGGETVLLRPETLDYWRGFDPDQGLAAESIEQRISPLFNQLTIFDARVPHGVRRVQGTADPRDGRVVLHGWFREPRMISSVVPEDRRARLAIEAAHARLRDQLQGFATVAGLLTIRIEFGPDGALSGARALTNTLVSTAAEPTAVQRVLVAATAAVDELRFPDGPREGWAVLSLRLPIETETATTETAIP